MSGHVTLIGAYPPATVFESAAARYFLTSPAVTATDLLFRRRASLPN